MIVNYIDNSQCDGYVLLVNSFRIGGPNLSHVHNSDDVFILHNGNAAISRNCLLRSRLGLPLLRNRPAISLLLLLHHVIHVVNKS